MKNIIYRRAHDYEYEKIIAMQSNIFYIEQGIPEDDVQEFLERKPICWCAEENDEIHMTARDTTVKIVCEMGGKITGEPYPFYAGNVTPVILKKKNYMAI